MKNASFLGYGVIPRKNDNAKTYMCLKSQAARLFEFKGARRGNDVVRVVLLVALNNGYVEGSADHLGLCGQTVRNHLKQQHPSRLLEANIELVAAMKRLGALSKPLILAVDWHDEMYYGSPEVEGVVGTHDERASSQACDGAAQSNIQAWGQS